MKQNHKCFACDRKLSSNPPWVDTGDGQIVRVGSECYAKIVRAGTEGYQPPLGGPRLYKATFDAWGRLIASLAPTPSYGHQTT